MEFKNAYTSGVGLPFEKVTKDGVEYIRQINSEKLYEAAHDNVDSDYKQDPLISIACYINRNMKDFPNVIIDLGGNIALSKLDRSEFKTGENQILDYYKNHKDYEIYKSSIEKFRGENLFYIVTPSVEDFYQNEPFLMIPEVKDLIQSMHWHIGEVKADAITDLFYNWKLVHNSLTKFIK